MDGGAGSRVDHELYPAERRGCDWRSRLTYPGCRDDCCSGDICHIKDRGILQMKTMLQRETFSRLTGEGVYGEEESSRKVFEERHRGGSSYF